MGEVHLVYRCSFGQGDGADDLLRVQQSGDLVHEPAPCGERAIEVAPEVMAKCWIRGALGTVEDCVGVWIYPEHANSGLAGLVPNVSGFDHPESPPHDVELRHRPRQPGGLAIRSCPWRISTPDRR